MRTHWPLSLGGQLSLVNATLFAAIVAVLRYDPAESVRGICLVPVIVLSLPIAWWWLMTRLDYSPTTVDIVQLGIVVGLNSFLWGYGLAYIQTRTGWFAKKPKTASRIP